MFDFNSFLRKDIPCFSVDYFTSDNHFFHTNILKHCPTRKEVLGDTVEKMNEKIIDLWNKNVSHSDSICVLGDFLWKKAGGGYIPAPGERLNDMKKLLKILRGRKILVLGNHDNFTKQEYIDSGFDCVVEECLFEYSGEKAYASHDPLKVIESFFKNNELFSSFSDMPYDRPESYKKFQSYIEKIQGRFLCGHVHQMWRRLGPFINVGIDANNFIPVSSEKTFSLFSTEKSKMLIKI